MTNAMIDLKILPQETLAEMANEAAEQAEKNAQLTVQKAADAGRYLMAAKEQCVHGQWLTWLGANWNYSQSTASRYMTIASNYSSMNNLTKAKDVNDALRMIADSQPATAPRSERKPAKVVVTVPTDEDPHANREAEPDDDPTPDPPTIIKTAKGSEKVTENKKPRTAAITPEILPDEPKETFPEEKTLSDWCEHEILEYLVTTADDAKRRAKALRKAADKLDPPTKFVKPDAEDVHALLTEYASSEEFRAKYDSKTTADVLIAVDDFMDHFNGNGWMTGKVPMKDWRATARKWLRKQDEFKTPKGRNNAQRNNGKRGYTADEVFS